MIRNSASFIEFDWTRGQEFKVFKIEVNGKDVPVEEFKETHTGQMVQSALEKAAGLLKAGKPLNV